MVLVGHPPVDDSARGIIRPTRAIRCQYTTGNHVTATKVRQIRPNQVLGLGIIVAAQISVVADDADDTMAGFTFCSENLCSFCLETSTWVHCCLLLCA